MPQCIDCGKKGIFLRLDASGRCPDCQKAYQEEQERIKAEKAKAEAEKARMEAEKAKAEYDSAKEYYSKIIDMSKSVIEDIDVSDEDETNYNFILSKINDKKDLCKSLIELLDHYTEYNAIEKIICEDMHFRDDFSKRYGMANVTPFNKGMTQSVRTKEYDFAKLFSDLKKDTEKCLNAWDDVYFKYCSFRNFGKELDDIEEHPIKISQKSIPSCDEDMPELKTTGVSSSSGYGRLGTFIALDIETTGLNSDSCKIIEIAMIRFEDWEPIEKMQTLIDPQEDIPEKISSLTGITNEMVAGSPTFAQVIPSALDFIGNNIIVGHNLEFDIKFLYAGGLNIFSKKHKYYDTLTLSRKLYKDMISFKLEDLCDELGIRNKKESHHALSDCLATGRLFQNIVKHYCD